MRLHLACLILVISLTFPALETRAQCQVEPVATLPLLSSGRPVVQVSINDRPVVIMVDTGAEVTAITTDVSAALGLHRDPAHRSMIQGVGGKEMRWNAIVHSLRVGPLPYPDLSLPVVSLGAASDGPAPAGLLGMNLLGGYDLEFDFPQRSLTLYPANACSPVEPPWPRGTYRIVEAIPGPRPRLIVPVEVNGLHFAALFDTGAQAGVVTRSAAGQLGLSTVQIDTASVDHGMGVNKQSYLAHPFRFDSMTVGGEVLRHVGMGVSDFHQDGVDMILGNDYMRTRRFFVSIASQRLFIQGGSQGNVQGGPSARESCGAPAQILTVLSRVPLVPLVRPRLDPPERIKAERIEGCAGALFRVGPDGMPRDIRILTEWPRGYGLGAYVFKELSVTRFQLPADGTDALHYEAHRLHPS